MLSCNELIAGCQMSSRNGALPLDMCIPYRHTCAACKSIQAHCFTDWLMSFCAPMEPLKVV